MNLFIVRKTLSYVLDSSVKSQLIYNLQMKKYFIILLNIGLFFHISISKAQVCEVTDYLYLNDVTTSGGFVHKMKLNADKTATEIFSSGSNPWFPPGGVLDTPHGLGQDLNGNLYIGQTGSGPIAKIKCDGRVINPTFINDGGFNILSKDGYLYINSNDTRRINRYSLCDGSEQGYIILNGDFSYGDAILKDWGLDISSNGTFYVSAGFNFTDRDKNTYLYRFNPSNADFINHTAYTANKSTGFGGTLKSGTGTNGISSRNEVWGITHDPAGNIYVVVRDWEDPSDTETWILKFDSNFNLIDSMVELTSSDTGGFEGARGIVYYAPWDRLLIAGGPDGDCIAKVRPSDMVYVGALAANEPGQTPKTLRIASEACPVSASLAIDTTLCNVQVGDKIFLQNIIGKCNAPICGGTWTANSGNAGITFQECDLSFTVTNVAIGCGKFTLTNVGGTCGNFTIEVKVNFANVNAPIIAGNQTVCTDSEIPAAFTTTTSATGSNTIKYQWQKSTTSCTIGFSNISGAISSTYAPPKLSQTTYYRVVTTVDGGCTIPYGSCTDTSNCVTVSTKDCCNKPNAGTDITICLPKTSVDLINAPNGYEWRTTSINPITVLINSESGTITGLGQIGNYQFALQKIGDATCSDEILVNVNNDTPPIILCNNGIDSYKIVAQTNLTNVIWYNMAGTQVGTGPELIVKSTMPGLEDGTAAYYYSGQSLNSNDAACDLELCCPVKISLKNCCPSPNCVEIITIKN